MEIVKHLRDGGKTVIIASHDPLVYESDCVRDVLPMRDGKVLAEEIR